jgi:two-component system sensor histidine kinase/response regulator
MKENKILIVDNEVEALRVLERMLSIVGYSVIEATNAKDAIIIAKEMHPDLVILDILLPDMSGGETANILQNDSTTKDIPIIFLAGLLTKEEAKDRSAAEGRRFIAKPYKPDELLGEIRKCLYLN